MRTSDVGAWMVTLGMTALLTVFSAACGKAEAPANVDPAKAKLEAASTMIDHVVKAAKKFHAETGKTPKSLDELVAARALHIQKSADPWGQEFLVEAPEDGAKNQVGVEICSAGPDMSPGTDDDICKNATL